MPIPKRLMRSPAGRHLADYLEDEEARAVVRSHLAETRTSLAALAREIGIQDYDLRAFLAGTELFDVAGRKMRNWYTKKAVPFVEPEKVALAVLTRWAPKGKTTKVRRALAEAVARIYDQHGVKIPPHTAGALE